jgi:hypothetical protein
LLNEPWLAESICLDILEADPENTRAIVILLLALTDTFGTSQLADINKARQLLSRLPEYEQNYYAGLICERQGKSVLSRHTPHSDFTAYEWLTDAMEYYEKAEMLRPTGNDDAILRWNTCARLIMNYNLKPSNERYIEQPLE